VSSAQPDIEPGHHEPQEPGPVEVLPRQTARDTAARVITEVLAPWVIVLLLPIAVAWQATHSPAHMILWGAAGVPHQQHPPDGWSSCGEHTPGAGTVTTSATARAGSCPPSRSFSSAQQFRFLIHDRDTKFTEGFDQILYGAGIEAIQLPPQSPNLNAYAERWIRSLKSECLEHPILFGERSLAHVLHEYLAHHQQERNHQGLDNVIPFPDEQLRSNTGPIIQSERLGGTASILLPQSRIAPLRQQRTT
jgi:hypothetical protein